EQMKSDKSGESIDVAKKKTLFDRLGGDEGVRKIVGDFVDRMLADPRVNFERKGVKRGGVLGVGGKTAEWSPTPENVERVKTHLAQFIALATGGPATYDGKEMAETHKGMAITNPEF